MNHKKAVSPQTRASRTSSRTGRRLTAAQKQRRREAARRRRIRYLLLGLGLGLAACLLIFSIWKLVNIFTGYSAADKEYEDLRQYVLEEPVSPDEAETETVRKISALVEVYKVPVCIAHASAGGTVRIAGQPGNSLWLETCPHYLEFTEEESCGKCTPCRVGTKRLSELLKDITQGKGTMEHIAELKRLSQVIKDTALCGLGQTAPNPVLSTLAAFEDEYIAHVNGHCPAGKCTALLKFYIDPEKCKGCTLCARTCPADAIIGSVREVHMIDPEKCLKCGACIEKCRFGAIYKE